MSFHSRGDIVAQSHVASNCQSWIQTQAVWAEFTCPCPHPAL